MAYQGISTGTGPNQGDGDTLVAGAIKINSNFTEIYNALGNGSVINLTTNKVTEGTNLYYTDERAQDAVGAAINAGIKTGITVTYSDSSNKIDFSVTSSSPFTTRGFSMPI
jgi:hypothetical protein